MEMTDPHRFLGLHNGGKTIRLLMELDLEVKGKKVPLEKSDEGFFEYDSESALTNKDYLIHHPSGLVACDPYAFTPTFSREDETLMEKEGI